MEGNFIVEEMGGGFNAIFNNISAISWRPVLLTEETRVPEENHSRK